MINILFLEVQGSNGVLVSVKTLWGRPVRHFLHIGPVNSDLIMRYHQSKLFDFGVLKFKLIRLKPKFVLFRHLGHLGNHLLVVHTLLCMFRDLIGICECVFPYPSKKYVVNEVLEVRRRPKNGQAGL